MLKNLFISKVRINMLRQFVFNPTDEYHVRGLVRIMDEEINAVRRELQNLETAQLLISQRKGNKLFYRINPKCLILNELRSMLYKNRDDVKELLTLAQSMPNLEVVMLTENFLTGKYETNQDVDVLFVGEVDANKLTNEMKQYEKKFGKVLRASLLKRKDLEFQLKKRDPFLLNILKKDRILLIGSEKDLV